MKQEIKWFIIRCDHEISYDHSTGMLEECTNSFMTHSAKKGLETGWTMVKKERFNQVYGDNGFTYHYEEYFCPEHSNQKDQP